MGEVISTADFIRRGQAIHGAWYDYSAVANPKADEWVMLMCLSHGPFHIIAGDHLNGQGCDVCLTSAKQAALRGRLS